LLHMPSRHLELSSLCHACQNYLYMLMYWLVLAFSSISRAKTLGMRRIMTENNTPVESLENCFIRLYRLKARAHSESAPAS
jgi:hypothetical protein